MNRARTHRMWGAVALIAPALLFAAACSKSASPNVGGSQGSASVTKTSQATAVNVSVEEWAISPSASTVPAGMVTFTVTNNGTAAHEFVVIRTDTAAADFVIGSFEGEEGRFDEDTAGTNDGETGDMAPGTVQKLQIALTPGHYALVCNLPGHYGLGMHMDFTVS